MNSSPLLFQILGPLLILRGVSILVDRKHFERMIQGLPDETHTVSFSMIPVFLFAGFGALLITHWSFETLPASLISLMALGGVIKSAGLILFPRLAAAKARRLGLAGFLHVIWVACLSIGAYFTWIGWIA